MAPVTICFNSRRDVMHIAPCDNDVTIIYSSRNALQFLTKHTYVDYGKIWRHTKPLV